MSEKQFLYEDLDPESKQILTETFTTKQRQGYTRCEGFVLPQSFKNFADKIRTVEIRDDDIWVCTFPKSGTIWTQEMVWCLANGLDHKDVNKFMNLRFPFFELSTLFDNTDHLGIPGNSVESIEKLASPRFIKSHLPFNLLPEKLQNFSTNAKIIHVARNPRDTLISYYHHSRLLENYKGSFAQFVEMFFKGTVPFGPFPAHLKGYLAHKKNQKILFLKYEEMHKDLKSAIYKTAKFIGKSISEDDVNKLLDHLSFSNMKQNPAVNLEPIVEMKKKLHQTEDTEGHFMRRGVVGDWKERLNAQQCQQFSNWEAEYLNDVDFTFSV